MNLRLLKENELEEFISGIQEAFQKGYKDYFGKREDTIILREDIMESLNTNGAKAYVMEDDNKIIGGAVVDIN